MTLCLGGAEIMIGDVVYMPPKNKYPQYRRSDFDHLTYAAMWANHSQFIMEYNKTLFYEIMSKLSENPLDRYKGRA